MSMLTKSADQIELKFLIGICKMALMTYIASLPDRFVYTTLKNGLDYRTICQVVKQLTHFLGDDIVV